MFVKVVSSFMKKRFAVVFLSLIILVIGAFFWFLKIDNKKTEDRLIESKKVKVAVSFYPLFEFVSQVGKDKVEVFNISFEGADPHSFEPSAKDIVKIKSSKLFIFNGAGLDPWAEKLAVQLKKEKVEVVNMAENLKDYLISDKDDNESYDPHFWLDPVIAKKEVEIIRDALIKIDPKNSSFYRENADYYIKKLSLLHQQFQKGLFSCEKRGILVSHAAFSYLAKRYNLTVFSIAGITPFDEPSARRIKQIIEFVKKEKIRYIFFDGLASSKKVKIIAKEAGLKILPLYPISALTKKDIKSGKNYISFI